jgi:hypothetical protein
LNRMWQQPYNLHPKPRTEIKEVKLPGEMSCYNIRSNYLPGHSYKSVLRPTGSRFVAIKMQPGFSRMHKVPYLSIQYLS